MKQVKLFCFPYAGGSAAIYEKWKKFVYPSIELVPMEYSGRGKRFGEPLCFNMGEIVDDIYDIIKNEIDAPYYFFGHSMGSLVCYELTQKIKRLGHRQPLHIFFSGKASPNTQSKERDLHKLEDTEFKEELFKLEGTPREILENTELMDIFLPILRSDFRVVEEYEFKDYSKKLDCDFTILYGKDDHMKLNEIWDWQKHTNGRCSFINFPGGHFFINDFNKEIVDIVNNTLESRNEMNYENICIKY